MVDTVTSPINDLSAVLTITPESAVEFLPGGQARELIRAATQKYDCTEAYNDYRFGSGYYVELPRYVQHLFDTGRIDEVKEMLEEIFGGSRIPHLHWRRMVAHREKAIECDDD